MRRRLAWLVLSVTTLVVVALTVPLALLVRRQAADGARVAAERDVESIAALIGLAAASRDGPLSIGSIDELVGGLASGRGVVLPDGGVVGEADTESRVVRSALDGIAGSASLDSGWEVALPVRTRHGTLAVVAKVTDAELTEGVGTATALLALLGAGLVVAGALLADSMGRSLLEPVGELARVARRLGTGDLGARSQVVDPPELGQVAAALNELSENLDALITGEREAMADLSHRLRTPLTSLRLQAENLLDPIERQAILDQIDRMQSSLDGLITAVRQPRAVANSTDLVASVRTRAAFWRVLADDQERDMRLETSIDSLWVATSEAALGAAIDALIGNVFAHTPPGTSFRVELAEQGRMAVLTVEDDGPGFPPGIDPGARGASGADSTGLGLDIVRREAERCGGSLEMGGGPGGGARVTVRMERLPGISARSAPAQGRSKAGRHT
jgi:signal transduction histidine kinase